MRRNAGELRVLMGRGREEAARATLAVLASDGLPDDHERVMAAMAQLAEGLALQGRYLEASAVEPTDALTLRYVGINAAIWGDDVAECDCPKTVSDPRGPNGTTIDIPTRHIEEVIYSEKHGREMPIVRCVLCGEINVAQLPGELSEVEEQRGKHRSTVAGMSIAQVRSQLG